VPGPKHLRAGSWLKVVVNEMGWLFYRITEMLRRVAGLVTARNVSRRRQEDLYASSRDREDDAAAVRQRGGTRTRNVQVIGPPASSDGVGFDQEEVVYMSGDMVHTRVKYDGFRRCDCGAVLGFGNSVLGTCAVCGRVTCKQQGCSARCERCGALVCRRHAFTLGAHTFCPRHRINGLGLRLWEMVK
jgi:hypothetical protein